ncbi:MAG TPA: 50S ribosomal protein L3 N(5)-glutamine methyltransferase [Gammaproteobacteria bacterium]|nr:50S ribosomal protein L3 N(5)-glutamine methyltransferase [Gammaproteobacteria bacterium]
MSDKFSRAHLIEWVSECLERAGLVYGHGTESAWDEAAWLVLHALGLSPQESLPDPGQAVSAAERSRVEQLLERRIGTRKPLAYLIQSAWFCGLEFFVDERVLVPRSPIAELVTNGFFPWLQQPPSSVLDLCTGSGCIAVACALAFPDAEVVATDISEQALAVARINRQRYGLEERLRLYAADVFEGLPQRRYDLIVSNPPYVDARDMAALPPEYRQEPALGLAAGEDGLEIVRRILRHAPNYLSPQGLLTVEVGNSQSALLEVFPDVPFLWPEFEHGGGGVFMLSAQDLAVHRQVFQ